MKKIYTLIVVGLLANLAIAQKGAVQPEHKLSVADVDNTSVQVAPQSSSRANLLFHEEWVTGVPSGNQIIGSTGVWTSTGPDHLWSIDTDGPDGGFSTNIGVLSSSSGYQWVIFDPGNSNPSPGPYTDRAGTFQSPIIDGTSWGSDTVYFSAEHRHRFCCSSASMEIKAEIRNGGTTWYPVDMSEGLEVNSVTPNPTLTEAALCQIPMPWTNDVQIRFVWGGAGVTHYFWMIDDIKLFTKDLPSEENDLAIEETFHGDFVNDWDYEIFPLNEARPVRLAASILNNGSRVQDSTVLQIDITDPSSNVDTYMSTSVVWGACNTKDTVWVDGFQPDELGEFVIDYSVYNGSVTDATPADNIGQMTIDVSDTVFARDFGVYSNNGSVGAFEDANDNGVTGIVANQFTFVGGNNAHVKGLMTALDNNTHAGTVIWPTVWEFPAGATSFNNDWVFIADGLEHTVAANEISDTPQEGGEPIWVNLYFEDPVPVPNSASRYAVGVVIPAPPDTVRIPVSGVSIDFGAAIYGDLGSTPGTEAWFNAYTGSRFDIPMIRAIMDYGVGLEEVENIGFDLSNNFPNPFSDVTTFSLNLDEAQPVSYTIMDITGKVVHQEDLGTLYPGQQQIIVNGKNFETGVYNFQLNVGDAKTGRRIVYTNY